MADLLSDKLLGQELRKAYQAMREHAGHQHWWPGETAFEVCVGAILTQNTNWTNVEKAIRNLKTASVLLPDRLYALEERQLAELIRPAGYFNIKARRIRSFLKVLCLEFGGNVAAMLDGPVLQVRQRLLKINGIGPETADSILLYAGGSASFVIDAYTKRIFSRHEWCDEKIEYDSLKYFCEKHLFEEKIEILLDLWKDYHAQLVNIGKLFCHKTIPKCESCPLKPLLRHEGFNINNNK